MAIIRKPAKKTQNPLTSGGGGARGGSMGTGGAGRISIRPGSGTKPAPRPKVELKPEPSSVKIKPGKYNIDGEWSAAKANSKLQAERTRTSSSKNEKSALKAANKPLKSKSADAARQQSITKAQKALAAHKAGTGPKLTPAQKLAFQRGLTAFNKIGKKK